MNIKQAISLVEEYLLNSQEEINSLGSALPGYVNPNIKLEILNDKIEEHEFGWVFYYNSKKFIETGDYQHALAGNAPLIVDRNTGQIVVTGTAHNTEYYTNNYKRTGDPNNEG